MSIDIIIIFFKVRSKSRSTPAWAVLQIYPNAATTLPALPGPLPPNPRPPGALPPEEAEQGRRGLGLPRRGSIVVLPLWLQCPSRQPRYSVSRLLDLPTLTLSPSDPLSEWASSGQQPQQQHIPTQALPSSERPWHCPALLSWRQTVPAPGLRLVKTGRHRACSPGVPAPETA